MREAINNSLLRRLPLRPVNIETYDPKSAGPKDLTPALVEDWRAQWQRRKSASTTPSTDIRDTTLRCFLLRTRPTAMHTYMVEYGRGKKKTLGTIYELKPAEARSLAEQVRGDVRKGIDPMEKKRQERAEQRAGTWGKYLKNEYGPWVVVNRKSGKATLARLRRFQEFESKKLKNINLWAAEKWRSKRLKAGKTRQTVNRDLIALKAVLSKAVEWKLLDSHPLKGLKLQDVDDPNRVRHLNDDEAKRLRDALDAREERHRRGRDTANAWRRQRGYAERPDLRAVTFTDHLKPMTLLVLNTGLRRGEIFNLQWSHVDLENAMLQVQGSGTKTVKTRYVPLNDEALSALKAWRDQTTSEHYVFPARDGGRLDNIKKSWRGLMQQAKIHNFNFHDARHDFASRLVMAGVDLNTVRELLGHQNIDMTLRYAHLAPEHKRLAVTKLTEKSTVSKITALQAR